MTPMRALSAALASPVVAALLFAVPLPLHASDSPRSLLVVTDRSTGTVDGRFPDIDDEEVLALDADSGTAVPFVQDVNWRSLLGDANGNGLLDDVPSKVDAIAADPTKGEVRSAYDLFYSFST